MQAIFFPQTEPKVYTFVNSRQVTITHSLGYIPTVQVLIDDNLVFADIHHIDTHSFVVTFANAKTGTIIVR